MNAKELQLGMLIIREHWLTKDQLKKALIKQGEVRRFGRHKKLGEILTMLGYMTQEQVEHAIALQESLAAPPADCTPLGLLLIDKGLASPSTVYTTLVEQQLSEGKLGEILVQKGIVTVEQLEPLLAIQDEERRAAQARPRPAGNDDGFVVFDAGG